MKTGFSGRTGQGPAQLDATIAAHLGPAVFNPADLMVGAVPGGDADAARARVAALATAHASVASADRGDLPAVVGDLVARG